MNNYQKEIFNGDIGQILKIDPLEVRRRNCYGIDDRNITPYGQVVRNNHLTRLFDEIAERGEYRSRVAEVAKFNATSRTHLRGIACTAVKFGISFNTKFLNQANALVNVYLDGSVQVSTGATEMGQGVNTKIRQIVADEFGIDAERVLLIKAYSILNLIQLRSRRYHQVDRRADRRCRPGLGAV